MIKRFYQLRILVICFFTLYLFYGCETVPVRQEPLIGSPVAHAPKIVVGDSWTYEGWSRKHGIDVYTIKVVEVESDGSFTVESVSEKGNERLINNYDSMARRINPPATKVKLNFPLFVGKQWEAKFHERSVGGKYHDYKQNYLVKKYEKVDTKAGNFSAFKIAFKSYNSDTGWSGAGQYWYSPEVKIIVKETTNWRYGRNLISYKLATDVIAKQSEQQKIIPQVKQSEQQKVVTGTDKPKIIMTSERIKIGILEFRSLNKEAKNDELGKVVSEMLTTSFVNSDAFKIIEREQLQKIVKEFELSQSGIIDTSDAKKIGKIAGATAIVTGSVVKMGDHIRLDARIIDVESGIILTAEKNEGRVSIKSIGAMTDQIVSNLVNKFYQEKK